MGPRPFPAVGDQKEIHVVKKLFSFFALSLRQTFPIRSPPSLPPSASFLSLFRLLLSFILPCLCLCIYLIGQARKGIEKKGKTTKRLLLYSYLRCLSFLSLPFLARKEERSPKVLFAVSSSGRGSTKRVERRDKQEAAISLYCLEQNVPILEGRLSDSKVSLAALGSTPKC